MSYVTAVTPLIHECGGHYDVGERQELIMGVPPLPEGFDAATEFPILEKWSFFNHAGVAPVCARGADALRKYALEAAENAYLTGRWYRQAEGVRKLAARIINADAAEVAF